MDHTLIRYHSEEFEKLSHAIIREKLIKNKHYPESIRNLPFSYDLAIRGLVIDRKKGNLLKLNRHSAIRASYHGLKPIDYKTQQKIYKSTYIDLADQSYLSVDTIFSISLATLLAQIIELKDAGQGEFPDYPVIAEDVLQSLDEAHRDGSIKNIVRSDLGRFIIQDPELVEGLEKFKSHGKKIFIVTNSDFGYTQTLLNHAINPYLKHHKDWKELFEIVIVSAQKPRFFFDGLKFLKVNPEDGSMTNFDEKLTPGIYQAGNAQTFTKDFQVAGDEILYVGDHIYGDILRLKKDCGWRTAMVIEELEQELSNNLKATPTIQEIDALMKRKEPLEDELTVLLTDRVDKTLTPVANKIEELQEKISLIDTEISRLIKKQQSLYNPFWGQLMRTGNEESYFAHQVDRFACVYMSKLADLFSLSPRTYFRAPRRPLAHEID